MFCEITEHFNFCLSAKALLWYHKPCTANNYPTADKPFAPAVPGAEIACPFQCKDPQHSKFLRAHQQCTMPPID